jgi:DNA-binding MarR family transcriptional regulator
MTAAQGSSGAAIVSVRQALAALELAGLQHRRGVRQQLRVGDEELTALLHLAYRGPVTQGTLGEATGLSRSGVGAMVQRLEEHGYVQRSTDPHDRRLRLVALSDAGRDALGTAYGDLWRATTALLEASAPDHLETLVRVLHGLAGASAPAAEIEPAREELLPAWRRWN